MHLIEYNKLLSLINQLLKDYYSVALVRIRNLGSSVKFPRELYR